MSNQLEFGLFDSFGPFEMSEFATVREVYEAHLKDAVEAEQLGYRYYFFIEHQNSPVCAVTAPNIYLTALACRTNVLRFGLMIYQLPFHHPVRLAQDLATLDQLSSGRVEFGAGTGVLMHEFIRWNLPFESRHDMSAEALDIIVKAWTSDTLTYPGKYWQLDEAMPTPGPISRRIRPSGSLPTVPPPSTTRPNTTTTSRRTSTSTRWSPRSSRPTGGSGRSTRIRDPCREHFSRATSTSPRPMRRLAPRRSPTY